MRARVPRLAAVMGLLFPSATLAQPAPPGAAPVPAPAPAAAPAAAPAPPSQLPVLNAAPEPAPPPAAPPAGAPANPPGYYVEQVPPGSPGVYEPPPPPPPGAYEPPPPPVPNHVAPRSSLWLSVRVGWLFPFGNAFAAGVQDPYTGVVYLGGVPWTDYVNSGPAFELDAGVRLARNYNVFALWERAQFTAGSSKDLILGTPSSGDSDYFALGLRASSDADKIGVLTELSLGYRQARARYEDGGQVEMTGGILEGRIGVGVDLRLSPLFSLQPIVAIGVGSFDRVKQVLPGGGSIDLIRGFNTPASHSWVSVGVGGSVDLFGAP